MEDYLIVILVFIPVIVLIGLIIFGFLIWKKYQSNSHESVRASSTNSESQNVEPKAQELGSDNLNFQVVDEFVYASPRNSCVSYWSISSTDSLGLGPDPRSGKAIKFHQDPVPSKQRPRDLPSPIRPISSFQEGADWLSNQKELNNDTYIPNSLSSPEIGKNLTQNSEDQVPSTSNQRQSIPQSPASSKKDWLSYLKTFKYDASAFTIHNSLPHSPEIVETVTESPLDQVPSSRNQRRRDSIDLPSPINSVRSFRQLQENGLVYTEAFDYNVTTPRSLRPPEIVGNDISFGTTRNNGAVPLHLTPGGIQYDILSNTAPLSSNAIISSQGFIRDQARPDPIISFNQSLAAFPNILKFNSPSIPIANKNSLPSPPSSLSYSKIAKSTPENSVLRPNAKTTNDSKILKPLRIAVDATPRGIGGYCIDRNKSRIEYYSASSRIMPWFLWDRSSRGNSSEFEMKNLFCALLMWYPLMIRSKRVEIYTDNMAISGKNEYGRRVRSFIFHLQNCEGVEVMNLDAMHLRRDKFPDEFEDIIGPADLLSRNCKEQFVNNVPGFYGMNYEPIIFTKVRLRATYWANNVCPRCGFQIIQTGSFKKPKRLNTTIKHKVDFYTND